MKLWLASALLALAAGGGLLADQLLCTDPATGFALAGPVGLRYAALALAVFLLWLFALALGRSTRADRGRRSRVMALAFALAAAGFALSAALFAARLTPAGFVQGALALAGAGWCGVCGACFHRGLRQPRWGLWGALGALAVFFVHTIERFALSPSSIQRVAPTVEVLAALSGLMLCCALMRWLYLPEQRGSSRRLFFFGMLCFLLCGALGGVLAAARLAQGGALRPAEPALFGFGLLGAAAALRAVRITRRLPRRMREM